jgi:EF-P beta-lysylation protein EpmB
MLLEKNPWQSALIQAVTDPKELLELLELNNNLLPQAISASKQFPLKVPRGFIGRMEKGNRLDPLLLQVLPVDLEEKEVKGYGKDPLAEQQFNPIPGLLHKYQSRVLLTLTGACGIHCRYCFRRHFPYSDNNPGKQGRNAVFEYIENDPTIHEVILSGGDPLTMSDHLLSDFVEKLATIPHLKRLRIHSRMPIVLPERVTEEFITWICKLRLKTVMVIHCNHAKEINAEVIHALNKLTQHGITLLNQSVLLKGINDTVEALKNLSESLFAAGVLPYYLHVLDKVQGAAHFDIDREIAKNLHAELSAQLSGYLVPRLVTEQAGAAAKLNI